jgi:prolyl 4-hydroxylase
METCMADPIAQNVVNRIEHLTQIPQANSESLQLLRYEEGQYYGVHHDLIEEQTHRPPGVRILTFYMYLNGNEESDLEGGGTSFPRVGITVTPKKGRAALWSSVLNEDPHRKDPRTDHTALPVIKGVKYGT